VFKYFLISVVIAPLLLGVLAVRGPDEARNRVMLRTTWLSYAVLWFCVLYYLRHRWS
jgi:hypothetical protein